MKTIYELFLKTFCLTSVLLCFRTTSENKRITTQQLIEVQAKLNSLRNKYWFGTEGGDVNAPLSWGASHFVIPTPECTAIAKYVNRRLNDTDLLETSCRVAKVKKKSLKTAGEKKSTKKAKQEEDKEKPQKKTQFGYKTMT